MDIVKIETLTPADRFKVPSTSNEEVKALLANMALAQTSIPMVKPTPDQPVEVVAPKNRITLGSHHGIVTPSSVSRFP